MADPGPAEAAREVGTVTFRVADARESRAWHFIRSHGILAALVLLLVAGRSSRPKS